MFRGLSLLLSILLFFQAPLMLWAAAVTDGTVGAVTTLSGNFTVPETLGSRAGNNLFHSFSTFNINSGESATFTGANDIQNVVSRVTGTGNTTIDGLLKSEVGNANFYFLNPNGVVFGVNARIDVPAAFHASTADYVSFGDGSEKFYADLGSSSTLAVANPKAFGFLDDMTASIVVDGAQLAAKDGQTLSLIGGNITIKNSAKIEAPSGRLNVVAVAGVGEVELLPNEVTTTVAAKGDVTIQSGAKIHANTSGAGAGGTIHLSANQISLEDGGEIAADTRGAGSGGTIELRADDVTLSGASKVSVETYSTEDNAGEGGNLLLDANRVELRGKARLSSSTYGKGQGGNMTLNVGDSIRIVGNHTPESAGIVVDTRHESGGNAGSMVLSARSVDLRDGGRIEALSEGRGRSGDITMRSAEVTLAGDGSSVSVQSKSSGAGGALTLASDWLTVQDGASVEASTAGGRGGSLQLSASRRMDFQNGAFVNAKTSGSGGGGSIQMDAPMVSVVNGSRITADAESSGDGGGVSIRADRLTIASFDGRDTTVSSASLSSRSDGGRAGDLDFSIRDELQILGANASISTYTAGGGNAGAVSLGAEGATMRSLIVDGGRISASSSSADSFAGEAGRIVLRSDLEVLRVQNGGRISTSAHRGDGGTLWLGYNKEADGDLNVLPISTLEVLNGGQITAETLGAGLGGDIKLAADQLLIAGEDAEVSARTLGSGDGGGVQISANRLTVRDGGHIGATTSGSGNGGRLLIGYDASTRTPDPIHDIQLLHGGQITGETSGTGRGGTIELVARSLTVDSQGAEKTQITSSSVSTASDGGDAGGLNLRVYESLTVSGEGAAVSSLTKGGGSAGTIRLGTASIPVATATIAHGGKITAETHGSGRSGDIDVAVAGLLQILDGDITANTYSSGRGGNLTLHAGEMMLRDAGTIDARTTSSGNAGTVHIDVNGSVQIRTGGSIETSTRGSGKGGDISLEGYNITLDGANLYANAYSIGDGGTVTLTVNNLLRLEGRSNLGVKTSATVSTAGVGNAGDLLIQARQVDILGAAVAAETSGSGEGGTIGLIADGLTISDGGKISAETSASGRAGDIEVAVSGLLQILDGEITGNTSSSGAGGTLTVHAGTLMLDGQNSGRESGILAAAQPGSTGHGGALAVTADQSLQILNGAEISAHTHASGHAGTVTVTTPMLTINSGSLNLKTSINSASLSTAVNGGAGGQITVHAADIELTGAGATITTLTAGGGDGGNIQITGCDLLLDGGSISSSSELATQDAGDPGTITINACNTITLLNDGKITTEANDSPDIGGSPDAGSIILRPRNRLYLLNSQITTSIEGGGSNGGNIDIPAKSPLGYPEFVILNRGTIQANAYGGNGGNINIFPHILMVSDDSVIEASSELAKDGEIKTTGLTDLGGALTQLGGSFLDANPHMPSACAVKLQKIEKSTLTIGGRGGVPIEPNSWWPGL